MKKKLICRVPGVAPSKEAFAGCLMAWHPAKVRPTKIPGRAPSHQIRDALEPYPNSRRPQRLPALLVRFCPRPRRRAAVPPRPRRSAPASRTRRARPPLPRSPACGSHARLPARFCPRRRRAAVAPRPRRRAAVPPRPRRSAPVSRTRPWRARPPLPRSPACGSHARAAHPALRGQVLHQVPLLRLPLERQREQSHQGHRRRRQEEQARTTHTARKGPDPFRPSLNPQLSF